MPPKAPKPKTDAPQPMKIRRAKTLTDGQRYEVGQVVPPVWGYNDSSRIQSMALFSNNRLMITFEDGTMTILAACPMIVEPDVAAEVKKEVARTVAGDKAPPEPPPPESDE